MSEPKKKPQQSNASRTAVIAAVAVLIIVAVAGIVLAGRRAPADPGAAAVEVPAAPAASSASTSGAPSTPTGTAAPGEVVFAAGSDKLPAGASESLVRFAESLRGSANPVRLSARFLTGANKARDQALAIARTSAVRHALEANGVATGRIQIELIEMPAGALSPELGNRVDLTLR